MFRGPRAGRGLDNSVLDHGNVRKLTIFRNYCAIKHFFIHNLFKLKNFFSVSGKSSVLERVFITPFRYFFFRNLRFSLHSM